MLDTMLLYGWGVMKLSGTKAVNLPGLSQVTTNSFLLFDFQSMVYN